MCDTITIKSELVNIECREFSRLSGLNKEVSVNLEFKGTSISLVFDCVEQAIEMRDKLSVAIAKGMNK